MTHTIRYASQTDVGIKRSHNQDACSAQPATDDKQFNAVGHLFVVADGMGGHAVGEKASAKAVRDIPLTYQKLITADGAESAIRKSFAEANAGIFQIGQNNPEFKGLGTTGTALILRPEGAWIGHVGDSRAYRIRGGKVQQLTFDHSWVWEIARRQGVDPEELGDFKRNVIIRSLGPEAEVEVDIEGPHAVEPGDQFLLCSDGLTNHVKPDEIGAVVSSFPPPEACRFLIELANLRGGSDNITCVIVQVPGDDAGSTKPTQAPTGPLSFFSHAALVFPALVIGGILIAVAIWMRISSPPIDGSEWTFGIAAVLTLVGLAGLVMRLMSPKLSDADAAASAGDAKEFNVYKEYAFNVDEALCARLVEQEQLAKTAIEEATLAFDQNAYSAAATAAATAGTAGDWTAAFRHRCSALKCLAIPLNKHQHKDEAFKPNWTTPHRGLGS